MQSILGPASGPGQGCPRKTRFLRSETQQKVRVLGAKANVLRRSVEEIRPDGEFLDRN